MLVICRIRIWHELIPQARSAKENHGELITCWALATLRSDIKQFHVIDKEGIDRAKLFKNTKRMGSTLRSDGA